MLTVDTWNEPNFWIIRHWLLRATFSLGGATIHRFTFTMLAWCPLVPRRSTSQTETPTRLFAVLRADDVLPSVCWWIKAPMPRSLVAAQCRRRSSISHADGICCRAQLSSQMAVNQIYQLTTRRLFFFFSFFPFWNFHIFVQWGNKIDALSGPWGVEVQFCTDDFHD